LVEQGHERIGFFSASQSHDPNRLRGLKRALREAGLAWNDEMSFFGHHYQKPGEIPFSEQLGQRMGAHFCTMDPKQRPTAMCITDDYVAVAFVAEVMRNGLRVPHDVSVVGHDDLPVAAYACAVPLTTVSQPVEAIARETVGLLTSRLNGEYSGVARRVVVQGELVVRQSTAAFEK
jgi:DNA-binding LacI/PurR family transcriptional regulator